MPVERLSDDNAVARDLFGPPTQLPPVCLLVGRALFAVGPRKLQRAA